jgi:hypothetical protein
METNQSLRHRVNQQRLIIKAQERELNAPITLSLMPKLFCIALLQSLGFTVTTEEGVRYGKKNPA